MIKIYNIDRQLVATTSKYNNMEIQREINQVDKLKFYTNNETGGLIQLEGYVETNEGIFVVKENALSVDYSMLAHMDLDEFNDILNNVQLKSMSLKEMLTHITSSKNWSVIGDSEDKKTLTINDLSIIDSIFLCVNLFSYEIRFNNKNREITIGKTIGEDKGVYFHTDLNLKSINMSSDTYDYATRLVPKGKDGLGIESVNNGVPYVENYTFSNKIITKYWSDERYTIPKNLKLEAEGMLAEMAKPVRSLECTVADLSSHSDYGFMDYDIGDFVHLIDKNLNIKEKYRIGSLRIFPDNLGESLVVVENKPRDVNDRFDSQDEKIEEQVGNIKEQEDRLSVIEDMLGISNGGNPGDGDWGDGDWGDGDPGDGDPGDGDGNIFYTPTQLINAFPSLKIGRVSWVDVNKADSVDYSTGGKVLNVRDFFSNEIVYTQDEMAKRPNLYNMDGRRWLSFNPDPMVMQRWRSDAEPENLIRQEGQYLNNLKNAEAAITILIVYHDRTPEPISREGSYSAEIAYPVGYSSPIGNPYSEGYFSRYGGFVGQSTPGLDMIFYNQSSRLNNPRKSRIRDENILATINNVSYKNFQTFNSLGMNKESYEAIKRASDYRLDWVYNMNAFFTGEIAEVIVYRRELGVDEMEAFKEYLSNKYSIQSNISLEQTR